MPNRLADESSPYLLQHADNPVDWYPWGDEAFDVARREDKPIFVSIGYAACHWCHVMAHESFEDEAIAELMNELFVNIKIDREERPDVDAVYMNAIHVTGEGGGWPLSAFCDSDGRPYFLGTYFPPSPRHGRPSFPDVLRTMARVYVDKRDQVADNTRAVLDGLRQIDEHHRRGAAGRDPAELDRQLVVTAGRALAERCDPHNGGFGTRPKFPSSSAHALLGVAGRLPFGEPARNSFVLQAEKMAAGGIYDHVGGGFARYSVDERWLVPHFEKMLYDNGQLLAIYADAYAMTGDPRFAEVIAETTAWLEREMSDPAGGLWASLDADSEGVEGKFYAWTPDEVKEALGAVDAIVFCETYGVTEAGNFEGSNVLSRVTERGTDAEEAAFADMRARLLEARARRVRPATDTKVLSSWNALAISGLVKAWEATGHEPALALADRVADFLVARMIRSDGDGASIARVFKDGAVKLDGTIDDYAFAARAMLDLAFATGDAERYAIGRRLIDAVVERFWAERDDIGIFYMIPADADRNLIHRPESHSDGAIPSGAAVATEVLVMVGRLESDERALAIAERYLAGRAPQMAAHPYMGARLLAALDLFIDGVELVIAGDEGSEALAEAARRAYAPSLLWGGPWASEAVIGGKEPGPGGAARAYVCRGQVCSAPIESPGKLGEHLASVSARSL